MSMVLLGTQCLNQLESYSRGEKIDFQYTHICSKILTSLAPLGYLIAKSETPLQITPDGNVHLLPRASKQHLEQSIREEGPRTKTSHKFQQET